MILVFCIRHPPMPVHMERCFTARPNRPGQWTLPWVTVARGYWQSQHRDVVIRKCLPCQLPAPCSPGRSSPTRLYSLKIYYGCASTSLPIPQHHNGEARGRSAKRTSNAARFAVEQPQGSRVLRRCKKLSRPPAGKATSSPIGPIRRFSLQLGFRFVRKKPIPRRGQ
jgi:hypothetical protein